MGKARRRNSAERLEGDTLPSWRKRERFEWHEGPILSHVCARVRTIANRHEPMILTRRSAESVSEMAFIDSDLVDQKRRIVGIPHGNLGLSEKYRSKFGKRECPEFEFRYGIPIAINRFCLVFPFGIEIPGMLPCRIGRVVEHLGHASIGKGPSDF